MTAPLLLPAGATRQLATGGWRLETGRAELYLLTPERRRFLDTLEPGSAILPVKNPGLALLLVTLEACTILPDHTPAANPDWADDLDAGFAAQAAEQDAALAARLAAPDDGVAPGSLGAALADAAAHLGHAVPPQAMRGQSAEFATLAPLARITGMRASRTALGPGWWRDDVGTLILRRSDGSGHTAALWHRGGYRDAGGNPLDVQAHDRLGWRLYAPLADDIASFSGMARSVARGLGPELPIIIAAALGAALLGLLTPLATGWIFDDVVPSGYGGLLIGIGIALFVAALVNAAFAMVRTLAVARIAGRGQLAMAAGVSDHVLRLPVGFFRTLSAGDFNQRLGALEQIRALVMSVILSAGITALFAVTYLALMFVWAPGLAWVAFAVSLVTVLAVSLGRIAQSAPLRDAAERDGRLASLTYEILEGIAKLRAAAAEDRALARWTTAYAAEREATVRGERIAVNFDAFTDSWGIISLLAIFAAAALLVSADMPPGQFIAFLTAFAIFQSSFAAFSGSLMAIYAAQPLADRARPILTAETESSGTNADPGRLRGDIQISGLSFGYDSAMAPLLDGLSLSVAPGEHLAIVGGSGSGKSTILRLLLGFEAPRTGSIAYDGQELSGLDPARLRSQIGVVMQSSQLFAGSILENVRGATDAGLQACMDAADAAGLAPDLAAMPMGLHTMITEGAGTLSGGQRQRILIARALAGAPRILFFDEATSALDNTTQAVVARTLDGLNATRITIAHRLSTVRHATRICVLERGRFIETGSFTELMAKNGAFAALARRQLLED